VTVPATVANLGPGFDCLGVALGLDLKVKFAESAQSAISGKGRQRSVADSLIYRAFQATFIKAGLEPPQVRIEVLENYPSARGLGASASAIVSGILGAKILGGLALEKSALAEVAVKIEGHPDNVLPALFGGLILSVGEDWIKFEPTGRLSPLVLVSGKAFKTESARRALPRTVPVADAVLNAGATAALVAILSGKTGAERLMAATQDRLHQPARLPLMPETNALYGALRGRGIAVALSGAGPSLICIVESRDADEVAGAIDGLMPEGWSILRPGWNIAGAVGEAIP